MSAVHFRRATAEDIPAVHVLVESAYRGESAKRGWTHEADLLDGQRTDRDALAEIVSDPRQALILAHDGAGVLVGCVLVHDKGANLAYLGMLTVHPDLQSNGLGRALLEAAEAHARGLGAAFMEMTVIKQRRELIAWYLRRGYADTGREAPFPLDDMRFGLPKTRDLVFAVLEKRLG